MSGVALLALDVAEAMSGEGINVHFTQATLREREA